MKKVLFILLFSTQLFAQEKFRYYSYSTIAISYNNPEFKQFAKETVVINVSEQSQSIDVYFSDGRNPMLLKYKSIDATPEMTSYKLYSNEWGWSSMLFSHDENGFRMSCIPSKSSDLIIIYGPLKD